MAVKLQNQYVGVITEYLIMKIEVIQLKNLF